MSYWNCPPFYFKTMKREFKGTKGSWNACCLKEGSKSHYVFDLGEKVICSMESNDPDDLEGRFCEDGDILTLQERQANARLIQSAPDMLKGLIHALEMCEDMVMPTENDLTIMAGRLKSIINKALV